MTEQRRSVAFHELQKKESKEDSMEDLKRLITLMMVVQNGNLGDTQIEFERNVSTICGWDEDRTRSVIREAAIQGLIERIDLPASN